MEWAPIERQIADWFLERLNLEIPYPHTDLFETAALDSLAFVELMVHLEQAFGVTIVLEDVDVDNFRSITRIAAFIGNGHGASAAPVGEANQACVGM